MSVSLKGYKVNAVTFKSDSELKKGDLVKISDNYTVAACATGNVPCGIVLNTDGKYVCVQLEGYAKVKYSGTAPALGMASLAADGADKVKVSATGRTCMVVAVDTVSASAEIIF